MDFEVVQAFKTKDGELHTSATSARRHAAELKLGELLDTHRSYGMDTDEIKRMLINHLDDFAPALAELAQGTQLRIQPPYFSDCLTILFEGATASARSKARRSAVVVSETDNEMRISLEDPMLIQLLSESACRPVRPVLHVRGLRYPDEPVQYICTLECYLDTELLGPSAPLVDELFDIQALVRKEIRLLAEN